uniref:Uncharacterized protein n=1 Tax=Micrurus carvalhoi TaxID=3147026 RepID=A0A2H6N522_9SAUR
MWTYKRLLGVSRYCGLPAELWQTQTARSLGKNMGQSWSLGKALMGALHRRQRWGQGRLISYQLPSESEISGEEEQLEPVPSVRMRRAAGRREQLRNKGRLGSKGTGGR